MAKRVPAMLGEICPCCMRQHEPPACAHDSTAACETCGLSKGYLTDGMDGTRCWFCHTGRSRSAPPAPPPTTPGPSRTRTIGFLRRTATGVAAEMRDDAGYVYALTGVPAERDGRKGYAVEMRVVRVPKWAAIPGDAAFFEVGDRKAAE